MTNETNLHSCKNKRLIVKQYLKHSCFFILKNYAKIFICRPSNTTSLKFHVIPISCRLLSLNDCLLYFYGPLRSSRRVVGRRGPCTRLAKNVTITSLNTHTSFLHFHDPLCTQRGRFFTTSSVYHSYAREGRSLEKMPSGSDNTQSCT